MAQNVSCNCLADDIVEAHNHDEVAADDCWGGKRNSIVEISVSRFFFFGVSRVTFFFWRKSRMGKKNPFFQKKKRRGNTRTTQQPPLLPEEVKHIAPTDILGTSGRGKAMEPWREGWFLYSSPANGGNNVRQMAES